MTGKTEVVVLSSDSSKDAVDQFANDSVGAVVTECFTLDGYGQRSVQSLVHRIFLAEGSLSFEKSKIPDCVKDITLLLDEYVSIDKVRVHGLSIWVINSEGKIYSPVVMEINYGRWDSVPIKAGFTKMIAKRLLIAMNPPDLSAKDEDP